MVLDESIAPLLEQAWELLGYSDAMEALAEAYKPGRTFAQAFAEFYAKVFAAQGLLVLRCGRAARFIGMGAPVLRAALERADELHAALVERNKALEAAGYHAQVAVAPQSSLLFLIDEKTGARVALKRHGAKRRRAETGCGRRGARSTRRRILLGVLEAEPERISPSALLRPVFQDFLLSTSLTIGGPAEIAYFAQSAVLFERIRGRHDAVAAALLSDAVEPEIGELLRKHELTLERVFAETRRLAGAVAGGAGDADRRQAQAGCGRQCARCGADAARWSGCAAMDAGLGRSAETAASKMRYQMNRLRRLAANFQLQREDSIRRHAQAISRALYPGGVLQERLHGAAYYFARYGFELAERLTEQAMESCAGHTSLWL